MTFGNRPRNNGTCLRQGNRRNLRHQWEWYTSLSTLATRCINAEVLLSAGLLEWRQGSSTSPASRPGSRSHDSLLIFSSSGGEKTNTNPKRQRGGFGEIPKAFLSPNGLSKPSHLQLHWCNTFKTNHTAKATFKCSTSENKFP